MENQPLFKRASTAEEREAILAAAEKFVPDVRAKEADAEEEGYIAETCSCGQTYLAQVHFCLCKRQGCPFSTGKTLLEHWQEELASQEA